MAGIGFIVGIPIFSDVGFILMVPLVAVIAKNAGMSRMKIGVPLLVSLHAIHCIVPPHPAATAVTEILHADIGKVIMTGMPLALLCALMATSYIILISRNPSVSPVPADEVITGPHQNASDSELPGFGITLLTILMPLVFMVSKTILAALLPAGNPLRPLLDFLGNPFTALLISVIFAYWSLGLARGKKAGELSFLTGKVIVRLPM